MSFSEFADILTYFLDNIYSIGQRAIFGVSIARFWTALGIVSILISSLLIFGRSVPVTSISSHADKKHSHQDNKNQS